MARPISAGPIIMERIPTITVTVTSAISASTIATAPFRCFPAASGDTTPPSAPPLVRDGTGAGQTLALSSTQLSANWEPAVDAESGIKGYRYAIGTSPGGTDVAAWTPLANVLGVTQAGLSLAAGQTYYFSVKAVNGVGLVGPAAISKGQKHGDRHHASQCPGGRTRRRHVREPGHRLRCDPFRLTNWPAISTLPPTPRAASRATSTPSAPRRAAATRFLGLRGLPATPT